MADVLAGLASHWAAQPELVSAMGATLWDSVAPEGTRLPYAVVMLVSSTSQETTGDTEVEIYNLSIIVRATTAKAARDLVRLVKASLNKSRFVAEGRRIEHCLYTGGNHIADPNKGPLGKDVWASTADFEVMISRSTS